MLCTAANKKKKYIAWKLKVPKCSSAVEQIYKSWCSHMVEYYTAMKMENLPPPPQTSVQKLAGVIQDTEVKRMVLPEELGLGGRMKGSWGLIIFCFLIWVVVTYVCSMKICQVVQLESMAVCMLYIQRRFWKSVSCIRSCTVYDSICWKHMAQVSLETESRPEAVRDWSRGWGVTVQWVRGFLLE